MISTCLGPMFPWASLQRGPVVFQDMDLYCYSDAPSPEGCTSAHTKTLDAFLGLPILPESQDMGGRSECLKEP